MSKFNAFAKPSERVNVHNPAQQTPEAWWTRYALPGQPQSAFYSEAARQDELRFSRQPKQIPVFNDVRFGGFKPQYQMAEWDPK